MNLIAVVDRNWAIGKHARPLVSIPEDIKLFRQETDGKLAIMGRKTYENYNEKTTLLNRDNIVITRDMSYDGKNARVAHSIEEVLKMARDYPSEDVYVIGGGEVFGQFLAYCDTAHITYVDYAYDADTHFPNLDKSSEWKVTRTSEEHTYFDLCYEFREYRRV